MVTVSSNFSAVFNLAIGETVLFRGNGSPEGTVVADIGALFQRSDGAAGNSVYFKQADDGLSSGWVPAGPHVREETEASGMTANFVTSRDVFQDPQNLGVVALNVYWNGRLQRGGGNDYSVSFETPAPGSTTISFAALPEEGDIITLEYLPE